MAGLNQSLSKLIVIAFLCCELQPCLAQSFGFQLPPGKKCVAFPFESINNLIVIPVTLNGVLPLLFILDTGVRSAILMDKTMTDFLKIKYSRSIELVGAAGGQGITALVANDMSFHLPGADGKNQSMLVLEEDYLQLSNSLGKNVHGIIGYDVFSRFIVEIDYQRRVLTLHEPTSFNVRKSFEAIPITIEDSKPYLNAEIMQFNGSIITTKLMMDTGASHSLLLHQSDRNDILLPEINLDANLGRGLGGDINGHIGRIKTLEFDKFMFEGVIASYPDEETYIDIIARTARQGTLGGGIFTRFHVIFDYFNHKVYLRKNSGYKGKFDYNMSGMEFITLGAKLDIIIVTEVRKNSPAAKADIRKGDIIEKFNSNQGDQLSLAYINNLVRSKPGKRIRMKIRRDNQYIKKKFRLKRLL